MGKKSVLKVPTQPTEAPAKLSAMLALESGVLGWLARKRYKRALNNADLRMKVVKEVIETEKSYLQSVECIVLDYLESIRNSFPPLLPPESITMIFGKIEDIFLINKELYQQLTSTSEEKAGKRIGDIFLKTAPYLKLYSEYCKNYPLAIAKLKKHLEEERFAFFVKKIRGDGSILDLPSLLIMPVQRIPRYKLLLIELLKRTDPVEPDFGDLNVALGKVSEVADHINNVIKERQNIEKLLSIQKKLTGTVPPIAIPRRVFIREGSLMKVCRKVSKKRWFILFNDAFIYGSILDTVGKYKFHRLQTLVGGKVKDVPDKPKHKNAFQIICKEKSFTVFAATPEEKRSWYSSFESAFSNINHEPSPSPPARFSKHFSYANLLASTNTSQRPLTPNTEESESAPVWVPDSDAERCMHCSVKFTAFKRRHHCRKCGKVVCAKCSNYSYKLDNLNKTARVCAFCFKELTQIAPNSVSALPTSDSYENLVEFLGQVGDYTPRDDAPGVVNVKVKRINANEKGMGMVKGKVLVPQTRKAQRKPLYNITNTVANGGEKEQNGTSHAEPNPESSTDPSLPPLPPLPSTPRQRSNLASSSSSTPPLTAQHNHSPNLRPLNLNANNTPPSAAGPLDTSLKSERQGSVDSMDTQNSLTEPSEDMSSSVPSSIDEHNPSPKLQPRQVVVGN
eukprot:Phypoly_transcript_04121.p1 GENE.Phypoly_transcript_04121~~Phypoly_transcript_04121.p1  ORF type:complete len:678 (+),score=110.34 Phypoly_transcript_04121:137-2170(+)